MLISLISGIYLLVGHLILFVFEHSVNGNGFTIYKQDFITKFVFIYKIMQLPQISIVIPLYNEEAVFSELKGRLIGLKEKCPYTLEFVLVDDGSSDKTASLIEALALEDEAFYGVFLSRNFGHQIAISAGMVYARGTEAVMLMDGDLQDPPELVIDFYEKLKQGYDVVYAVRRARKEAAWKKTGYWLYYRMQRMLTTSDIPLDSGDFSMMSRRVVDHINAMPEQSRFVRGLRSWVGYKQIGIEYKRDSRSAGETKYSLKRLFKLAYDGIFNFGNIPLKLITRLGLYTILLSLIYITVLVVKKIFYDNVPEGYTTIIIALALFSGVQLICLGVIGEYVARIFDQSKGRPLFVVNRRIINGEEKIG